MTRYDHINSHKETRSNESDTPLLDKLFANVINNIDPHLRALAARALGTTFHPEIGLPKSALATNSFREQWQLLTKDDPGLEERFAKWGVGSLIDSVKQQDVNLATDRNAGDSYILNNLESALSFAKVHGYDVMIGRYSGDELVAFFIPKNGPVDPEELNQNFLNYNKNFLSKNTQLSAKLNSILPKLRKHHGKNLELGATIKSKSIKDLALDPTKNLRDRQLLSTLIDHIEGKHSNNNKSTAKLATALTKSWNSERTIVDHSALVDQIPRLESLLPPSIKNLYHQAIEGGSNLATAATYAEEAAFEGIYPRMSIYRMEVFGELIKEKAKIYGKVVLAKSGDPYIKWTNKNVSHHAGDQRMLGLAETYGNTYETTAQHHGSFLHIINYEKYQQCKEQISRQEIGQDDADLNQKNHNPKPFCVTTMSTDPTGSEEIYFITPETSDEEIWQYIEQLGIAQTINEISVLIERAGGLSLVAINNLINYGTTRPNRIPDIILGIAAHTIKTFSRSLSPPRSH